MRLILISNLYWLCSPSFWRTITAQILHTMQLTNAFKIEVITRNILKWIIKGFEGTSTYHSYRLLLFLLGFLEASSEQRHWVRISLPGPLRLRVGSQRGCKSAGWSEGLFTGLLSCLPCRKASSLPSCSCTQECTWKQLVTDRSLSLLLVLCLSWLSFSPVTAHWRWIPTGLLQ